MAPGTHGPAAPSVGDTGDGPLAAGDLGSWLRRTLLVLDGEAEADVPCGGCDACCASRQFVHVEPDETATLARVPRALQFPAPGLPPGHVVIPYDADGRCPMLGQGGCTIYEARPRTCRAYDCRVFAATGLAPDADQPRIAARVARWRFEVSAEDRDPMEAVRSTAEVLGRPDAHPDGRVPPRALQLAGLAVALHRSALEGSVHGVPQPVELRDAILRRRAADDGRSS